MRIAFLLASALFTAQGPSQGQPAQQRAGLIVTNARIYIVDGSQPLAEAMAVRNGKVLFLSSTNRALVLRGASTRVVDLGGRTIVRARAARSMTLEE